MRTAALLVLVTAFLSVGTSGIRHSNRMSFGGFLSSANANFGTARVGPTSGDNDAAELLQPFQQKDTEYSFIYNAQIASGLQSAEQSAANPQQKAVTRIQCLANIHFASERHAQLRLEQCRVGQQNGKMSQPQEVQPMEAFEETNIAEKEKQQLLTPCQFSFADGVIERVQCPQDAEEWSKNVKKAVLNIIQLNLKQNNAQGLHKSSASHAEQQQQEATGQGKSFKIPEITVEGACQTMYTINKAQRIGHQQQQQQFNVTKTINFKKCQKIADVANGFQADQPQAQCAQCQQYWAQQQSDQQNSPTDQQKTNAWQMGESDQHPCAKCDPKEVKENEMDRSTAIRCRIAGDPADQYALRGCELRSQYIYRSWKSAEAGTNGAVMQTVVVANLEAVAVKPKSQQIPAINGASEHDTLMYSNDKAVDEKRFFANGDNEFGTDGKGSPFARVPKVQQAKQALLKLEQYTENNHKGIDQQTPVQQQRLVEMLRMCTEKELKQVEEHCANTAQQQKQKRGEKCHQMMANALAQCGTRNCVAELARKIKNGQVVQSIAVQSLLALNQLPSPSDTILDEVQQLCQSQTVAGSQALKQSCWLAFGALVNEVCQHTTAQNAKECAGEGGAGATANCVQSGFVDKDKCPADKKQKYKETLFAMYKQQQNEQQQTQCIYDKAVALGALGNAGLDIALADLERIIKDTREARVVRMMAIDATRRMRTQMPHSVRAMLLPVFLNTGEQPQVRITAFANILGAQPTAEVVDQLVYAIGKEPNREVQAYCYRTMKTMANSQKPDETQIAKHVKSSLKQLANAVDEQQLRTSGKWQFEQLYNNAQREGVFMSFVHAVSSRSALPAYAHVQLDSHFNDHYTYNKLNIYMVQQEAEQWYERAMNSFGNSKRKQKQQQHGSKQLSSIYEQLGIKSHRSDFGTVPTAADNDNEAYQQHQQQQQQNNMRPFAMLGLRSNNVDKAFIALDEHTIGEQTRRMLNGEEMKPNWAAILFGHGAQQQHLDMAIVQNMGEKEAKIATSAGVPLRILSTTPMMANVEGRVGAKAAPKMGPSAAGHGLSAQFEFSAMSARMAQIQKMELITPFAASGVESIRSLHINLPLQGELSLVNSEQQQGISIKVKLPQRGTQLASAHSLPFTFIAKAEPSAQFVREPRQIIAVHDPKLDQQQREVNSVLGQKALALPLQIRGHYHVPAEPSNLLQFAQLLMATENAVHVQYQPNEESPRELTIRASGEHFRKAAQMQLPDTPQLHNFYAQQFHSSSSCDSDDSVNAANCEENDATEQQQGENGGEQYISNDNQQQQLNSFISAYKPRQQYAHALRLSAQTSGGARDATAHANIQAQCDERMRYCTVQADANKNQQWTLSAQAQVVMPDTVPSVEQLQQPTMLKQFIALAKAQWGDQQDKQHMNVRIRGTQAHTEQTRAVMAQIQQQHEGKRHGFSAQQQRKMLQRSAFLNQFHVEATYALKAYAQNMMNRGIELLKSVYFWNTKSQLLGGPNAPKNGKIAATISIDPLQPSNANVTIRTPAQQLHMQQIQMPAAVGRPFPLIRQQSAQQTHSLAQLFYKQFSLKSRAQCIVDGRNVDTFDGFAFTAPLSSNCFSVLAKHCSSPMEEQHQQQPQFVVMLKKVPGKQNANKSAQKADKVLKVITAEQQIECQPKTAQGKKGQMICKVNGQPISGDEQCQDELQHQQCVQFNDPRQTDVTIRTGPIAVRFNGRKAWLKVSQAYKNAQCGLCGHYDDADEQEQELRMANGQIASNLVEFHRSYALKDAEQCTQQALNSFYNEEQQQQQNVAYGDEQQTDNFYGQYNQWKITNENGEEDEEMEQYSDREENNNDSSGEAEEEEEGQKEQFDGQIEDISDENWAGEEEDIEMSGEEQPEKCCCCCAKEKDEARKQKCRRKCQQSDECRRKCQQKQCQQQQQQRKMGKKQKQGQSSALEGQWEAVMPTMNTKVYEQNHALCFSTEPVKQCPRGTTTNGGEEADQQLSGEKPKRVHFVCMDRAESEARRLMRQLRRGQRSVKVSSAQGESFSEMMDEPQQCWRRRN